MEQEKLEENTDYKQELDDLKVCVYFFSAIMVKLWIFSVI